LFVRGIVQERARSRPPRVRSGCRAKDGAGAAAEKGKITVTDGTFSEHDPGGPSEAGAILESGLEGLTAIQISPTQFHGVATEKALGPGFEGDEVPSAAHGSTWHGSVNGSSVLSAGSKKPSHLVAAVGGKGRDGAADAGRKAADGWAQGPFGRGSRRSASGSRKRGPCDIRIWKRAFTGTSPAPGISSGRNTPDLRKPSIARN